MSGNPDALDRPRDHRLARLRARVPDASARDAPLVLLATTLHMPSTARLAIGFARAGCRVAAVCPADHVLRHTGVLSGRFVFSAARPTHALRHAVERTAPDLIIPCDDRAVRLLHSFHGSNRSPDLRAFLERTLSPPAAFSASEHRHELLSLARASGVRVPETRSVRDLHDLRAWQAEEPFPWVLKADGSWAGQGVRIVSSWTEASAAFHDLMRPISGMLAFREMLIERDMFWSRAWWANERPVISVQRYVDGWPANCGIACWQGEVLGGICVEALITETRTGSASVVRVIESEEMMRAAAQIVRALGITGLVGFDFMIEAATGAAHLIEMNPRNTPICAIPLGPGRDLVEALTARLSGRPERARPPVTEQDTIAMFPQMWRQDANSPFLRTAHHDVPWDHPELLHQLIRPDLRDRYWFMRRLRPLWQKVRRALVGDVGWG